MLPEPVVPPARRRLPLHAQPARPRRRLGGAGRDAPADPGRVPPRGGRDGGRRQQRGDGPRTGRTVAAGRLPGASSRRRTSYWSACTARSRSCNGGSWPAVTGRSAPRRSRPNCPPPRPLRPGGPHVHLERGGVRDPGPGLPPAPADADRLLAAPPGRGVVLVWARVRRATVHLTGLDRRTGLLHPGDLDHVRYCVLGC